MNSGVLPAAQSSFDVPELPAGKTLYATLLTKVNGAWARFQAVTFTAAPGHATFTNPIDGQQNVSTANQFTWSTVPGAQAYYMAVGTTAVGYDLVNSGVLPASQSSFKVPTLPRGKALFATLLTEVNGTWARYQAVVFTAG